MKRKLALVLVLVLFCTSIAYAQNLEFSYKAVTGLRFSTFGGGEDWYGPVFSIKWKPDSGIAWDDKGYYVWTAAGERLPYAPAIAMFNDYDGTCLDLKGKYTNKWFGVFTALRINIFPENVFKVLDVRGFYIWTGFLKNTLIAKLGRVQDNVGLFPIWAAPGAKDCEYSYAEGDGLRLEYTGIPGLNFGVAFFIPGIAEDYFFSKKPNVITGKIENFYKQSMSPPSWIDVGKNGVIEDFFRNTAFGVEYKSKKIDVAAGLKLDSVADGLTDNAWGDTYFGAGLWGLFNGPEGATTAYTLLGEFNNIHGDDVFNYLGKGMKAYAGIALKMLNPWTIKAGGQFYNLGVFDEYGWIQLNQVIARSFKWKYSEIKLSTFQTIFSIYDEIRNSKDLFAVRYDDVFHTASTASRSKVIYTFTPEYGLFWNANILAGISAPIKIWPGIVNYDISIKPTITYFSGKFLGKGLSIELRYIFNIIQFSKYSNAFVDGTSGGRTFYRNSDPLIQNTIQLQVSVEF